MADSLRDLVVSLSLNTDNFTRNIRSVQRQIQEAQSEFQLAAAGVQNFESTTAGLTAKLSTLERTFALQKDAIDQYQKALTAARDKLQECYDRQNDYGQRLVDAKQKQSDLATQVQSAQAAYDNYKNTLGETDSATIAAKQNLDALQEEYKAATEDVTKLEGQNIALQKSTQNAADAVSAANVKLNQANAALRTTQSEIDKTNAELALAKTNWKNAGEAIDAAKNALTTIGKQTQLAESRFKLATSALTGTNKKTEELAAKTTLLSEKITLQEKAVTQYEAALAAAKEQLEAAKQANDPEKIRQASDAVIDAQTNLNNANATLGNLRTELQQTQRQLQTARSAWTAAGAAMTDFGTACEKAGDSMIKVGKTLTTTITTPITALATTAVKASIDYESAFTDVRKVTDATEEEFAGLSDSIKEMTTRLAASATDIAEVVTSASRLGIQTDKLMEFTEVMINLGNSTDMTANDAATSIARFANIMGMSSDSYENLGSTLVALGNNYATTESEIMEMALRLAGAGKQVGLSESQILGFSAALSSVGIEAQMGGSSMSKALIKMEVAAATGGQSLEDFATVCGMTSDQFKNLWDTDPAAAFQAFIVGLSQMDDEGISAIAVLDEIGISEIRLRDTILRATNATELFSNTQATAAEAWEENTELASVAEQRYGTTASKLTNLKNQAVLLAQTFGDDLNPLIQQLISGASDLLDQLSGMDSAERLQILKIAAIAAAIGPVLTAFGKVTKTVGSVSKGIGAFATAVGKAGGGWKGFLTVLNQSPAVWLAVAAGIVVATAALADYLSGAKQTREALEGMAKTAENWKNTAANTFYGSSKGLSFFGMSTDDFTSSGQDDIDAAQDWLTGLITVWTDGKKETNAIVKEWTDSWKSLTQTTRDGLTDLKSQADAHGYTGLSSQMQADLDSLDSMDKEISKLLKKRQSKLFTEEDESRLQELVNQRNAIMVKYKLVPEDEDTEGFDTIRQKLQAEVARAQAKGQTDADASVYENAVVAAAQGMAAKTKELNEQYDSEFALIQLITDETEREAALADLNARYNADRKAAAIEYAELLRDTIMPVWEEDNIQKAGTDIQSLITLMGQYSAASETEKPAILEQMNELSAGMDESSLTEYISLLTQIQSLMDSGMSEEEIQAMFPEIDFSTALDQIAAIQEFLQNRSTELPGLASMFGEALPEEVITIATDLDMTGAQARWTEFAENPGAITTDAIIAGYTEKENAAKVQPVVDAFVSSYTEVAEGASKASLTPTGLIAYVTKYAEVTNGADVSGLTPEIATCLVAGYQELASGADVSKLTPSEIVAYVTSYAEKEGVDLSGLTPEGITAFVLAYEEVTGGALTTSLTPKDIAAVVTQYLLSQNVDMSQITDAQVDAMVNAYAEATGCDKTALKAEVVAQITAYVDAENVEKPSYISTQISITGYDLTAYRTFIQNNPITVTGILRLSSAYENPEDALTDENAHFWKDGVEIPATLVTAEMLTPDKVAILADDGTMHILITPEVTGSQEAITTAAEPLVKDTVPVQIFGNQTDYDLGWLNNLYGSNVFERMSSLSWELDNYANNIKGTWKDWRLIGSTVDDYNREINTTFSPETVASLQTYVAEMVTAILNGQEVSDEDLAHLQTVIDFINSMQISGTGESFISDMADSLSVTGLTTSAETLGTDLQTVLNTAVDGVGEAAGEQVTAGVGAGMEGADMSGPAETVASNTETETESAFDINSPSKRMMPIGENVSAGIAEGMTAFSFASAALQVSGSAVSAVRTSLTSTSLRSVGVNAMYGLRAGIIAGRSGVISAMRSAAQAAVQAAKSELQINSPSRVFRDEVGAMAMKGLGEGILMETETQAKAIRNAARYLTGEAAESAIGYAQTDNSRTYDNSSSVNLSGNTFYIRDEQDVKALAAEIATLTKRMQRGKGLRYA